MKHDNFWWVWHIFIYSASLTTIVIFVVPFGIVMITVNIPDIVDWFILRPIQKRKNKKEGKETDETDYFFHHLADLIRNKAFFWLPDLTYKRYGIITELFIICFFFLLIFFLK
jgi:hypothetical protein